MNAVDPQGKLLTGSRLIWEVLQREGVTVCFGYPGGAIMPAYDALPEYPSIHHVLVRHEQGASHMADGYARATGRPGVVIATSGPGATNLVTGLATAMLDSIPMVAITGQVPSHLLGTDAFQETDVTGVTLPVTKHNYLVTRAEDVVRTLREAFHVARSGRPGPVLVDITKDAQLGQAVFTWEDEFQLPKRPHTHVTEPDLDEAARLIREASRPLILAGQGVLKADACGELRELAERLDIPVAFTLLGLGGLPASHSHALGMMGMHGEAWVNEAIQGADLLIAVGMRFDDRVTGNLATYARQAKKIHIELDEAEIGKVVPVEVALVGDAREVLRRLLPRLPDKRHGTWIGRITASRHEASGRDVLKLPSGAALRAPHVIHDLWRLTGGDAIVSTDVGQHQMWAAQYFLQERPRCLLTSGGLGTMGFGLPAAMGAKVAIPDAEVWAIVGDGGFQMTACELSTCAQENLDINIAVIDNGYLGMVRQWQEFFHERRYVATPMLSPDFVKLAEAHGLTGIRVTSREQIPEAVARARAIKGTVLLHFVVQSDDNVFPMVPAGKDLHDMLRRPTEPTEQAE